MLKTLGLQAAGGAISTAGNMISNALGLTMSPKEAMDEQLKYNATLMGMQADYNKEAADYNNKLAKDYWDYTNAENQKKHLKEAGLNPALMYGQSGAGGMGATASGTQQGVSMPGNSPVAMGLQVQALDQQRRLTDAQIAETYARAEEAQANAGNKETESQLNLVTIDKIKGEVDNLVKQGKYIEALTQLVDAQEKNEGVKYGNILADTWMKEGLAEQAWNNANKILEETNKVMAEARKAGVEAEILEKTKDEAIKAASLNNAYIIAKTLQAQAGAKLSEKQIEQIGEDIKLIGEKCLSEKSNREARTKEVNGLVQKWKNDFKLGSDANAIKACDVAQKAVNGFIDAVIPL